MKATRRNILAALAAGALAAPLRLGAQGQLQSTPLAPGLTLIQGAGANVVLAESADEVLVVNGGLPEHAEALLAEINRLTGGKKVTTLFNTAWRPELCGLNHLLGPRGVRIIAHENTRLWQGADFHSDWQDRHFKPLPAAVQANDTFYKTGELDFGDEHIVYGFISQANTDGDIYVHFTRADVLVVGHMLNAEGWLLLDYVTGGWIQGAQKTTAGLLERAGEGTKIIAATGGILGKQDLQDQADMLAHAYDRVSWAFQNGKSVEELIASQPMAEFEAKRGDATLFLQLLYRSTWYHVPGRAVRNII